MPFSRQLGRLGPSGLQLRLHDVATQLELGSQIGDEFRVDRIINLRGGASRLRRIAMSRRRRSRLAPPPDVVSAVAHYDSSPSTTS